MLESSSAVTHRIRNPSLGLLVILMIFDVALQLGVFRQAPRFRRVQNGSVRGVRNVTVEKRSKTLVRHAG